MSRWANIKHLIKIVTITITILIFTACVMDQPSTVRYDGAEESSTNTKITKVEMLNGKLKLSGKELDQVISASLQTEDGNISPLSVEQQTSSSLILAAKQRTALVLDRTLSLILTDANGSTTQTVVFTIEDGEIAPNHLSKVGAQDGHVLKFNGSEWVLSSIGGLTYRGVWDANDGQEPNGGDTANLLGGDYYVVDPAGSTDLTGGHGTDSWDVGDWAIWNDEENRWEKISNKIAPAESDPTITENSIKDGVDVSELLNGSNKYFIYKPNDTACSDGEILMWSSTDSRWECSATMNNVVTHDGTNSINAQQICDTGGANCQEISKIVQVDSNSKLPAVDGSLLTNLPVTTTVLSGFTTGANSGVTNSDTVESAIEKIQGQLNNKQDTISDPVTGTGTDNMVALWNGTSAVDASANITEAELSYLDGVTSGIQGQIDSKLDAANEKWDSATGGINYAGGSVGIGTTPITKLDVDGFARGDFFISKSRDIGQGATVSISGGTLVGGGPTARNGKGYWRTTTTGDSITLHFPNISNYGVSAISFNSRYATDTNNTPRDYTIERSTNGSSWNTMLAKTGNASGYIINQLSGWTTADRYLRITVSTFNAGGASQIGLLQVFTNAPMSDGGSPFTTTAGGDAIHIGSNVGIGTIAPNAQLHVVGDTIFESASGAITGNKIVEVADSGTHTTTGGEHVIMGTGATVTLPASPSNGDEVKITPAGDWKTTNSTINPNGQKISGTTGNMTLNFNVGFKLIYVGVSVGWSVN